MKSYAKNIPIFLLIILLVGCMTSEKLTSTYVSKEEGKIEIYVIYLDHEQMSSSTIHEQVITIVKNHSEEVGSITSMYDAADIKKVFNLKEFPTILVFDTEKLVLKTTDSDELEELLTK